MTEPKKYSHEEMGFGDVQSDEQEPTPGKAVVPTTMQSTLPKAPKPVAPPLPKAPAGSFDPSKNATDILPPLPPTPSIVQNPVNLENQKAVADLGLTATGVAALIGAGLPYLYSKFASNKTPPPSGPELTINPAQPEAPVAQTQPQTIKSRSFSPKETAIEADINSKYPFTFEEAKKGLGLEGVKVTDPTQAEIVAKQYSNQLKTQNAPTIAPEYVPQAAEASTPVTKTAPAPTPVVEPTPTPAPEVTPTAKPVAEAAAVTEVATEPVKPPAKKPVAPDTEKLTKEQKGMKGHLVSMYGGGPEGEAAYGKVKEILGYTPEYPKGQGGGLSAEENKVIKDWRKANIEGPKINLTHEMKKGLKGGAGLAVLAAIPGFAEAASNKDFGKMTDIATDFLVLPFAQSREVGEGEDYELAKRRYEGMVGGGRGIAPPSPRQQVGRR